MNPHTLHSVLSLGIALSYYWILITLAAMSVKLWHQTPPFLRWTIAAFVLFICACGTGRLSEAFAESESSLVLFAHALTLTIAAPVALAMPTIAKRLYLFISHHSRLTKELSDSKGMFHAFLNAHPKLFVWIKDEALVTTYVNQAFSQMFGPPIGQTDEHWLPKPTAETMLANDRLVLDTGEPHEFLEKIDAPDGLRYSWLSYKFVLLVDGKRFLGSTATDITKQERLQSEMDLAFRELETLTHAASHDLKTPLRGIKGLLAILERKLNARLSDSERQLFVQVRRDCDYATDLVDGILRHLKLGQAQINRVKVDVSELLEQVCARFADTITATNGTICWHKQSMPVLLADRTQLQQVLENLIDNALKYRSEAPPQITILLRHRAGLWVFSVRDNGMGIDPTLIKQLFTMFSRLHSRAEIEGTGIGLASVKKIAQLHGGDAWIESEGLGCGSTVYFSLRSAR